MTPTEKPRIVVRLLRVYDLARPERWSWTCTGCLSRAEGAGWVVTQADGIAAGEAHLAAEHAPARPPMPSPTRWRAAWAKRAR